MEVGNGHGSEVEARVTGELEREQDRMLELGREQKMGRKKFRAHGIRGQKINKGMSA